MNATARVIIRNCGIEKSLEVAREAIQNNIATVEFYNDMKIFYRRTIDKNIANSILKGLSGVA